MQDFRLLIPACLVWAAAIASPNYLVLALVAAPIALAGTLRRNWIATLAGVSLVAGAIAGGAHNLVRESDAIVRALGKQVEVTGVIDSHPKVASGRVSAFARIESVKTDTLMSSNARIRLQWAGDRLERGTRFIGHGRLTEGGGQISARMRVTSIEVLSEPFTASLRALLRESVADRPWHAQLIPGVVIGDDTGLPEQARREMRMLSLSHLTAVSGAHVSLAIAIVLGVIGRRRPMAAGVLALVSLAGLVELVGSEASVLRAGYMGVFMCIAIALRRRTNALPLLNATVIAVSLLDVDLARSLGFQLSAVATFAIITFSYPLQRRLAERLPAIIADVVSIALIAGVATGPLLLPVQERASLWGILANALVAPVVTPLTIGGMAGTLLLPVAPISATVILRACELCTGWMAWVSRILIGLPGSNLPTGVVLAVNVGLLVTLIATLVLGGVRVLMGALAVLACASAVSMLLSQRVLSDWEAIQCDVGQGSAFLARGEEGIVLVDVGPESGNISACLTHAGVKRLDLLIISHFDADHVRGLAEVLDTVEVEQVWYSVNRKPERNSQWALDLLNRRGIAHEPARYGDRLGTQVEVIGPRTIAGGEGDSNKDSLVVVVTTASHRILILADAPAERQQSLRGEVSAIDVVVAGHHGARDQSRELAEDLKPSVSLFSVGENSYGHPTREALDVWHAPIQARTDLCGEIVLTATQVVTGCRTDVE
ncbi:ComEC/Rec2 family competence protein [Trueperella pyogenes]|uniref:ComEC/Rec2 family competence protein n=1 Tax=Trueperella pyogenes TaxID=1661 RepID=UPI00345CD8A3